MKIMVHIINTSIVLMICITAIVSVLLAVVILENKAEIIMMISMMV